MSIIISSDLELLEQCIVDLEAENAELRGESAKLRRIVEENSRHDTENSGFEYRAELERLQNLRAESRYWNKVLNSHKKLY